MSDLEQAETLLERARALAATDRFGDATAAFDEVITRFAETADPEVENLVGEALFWKAQTLQRIERDEQALAVYEQMAMRYRGRPEFRGPLARALVQRATTLARLGEPQDALVVWDEVLASFPDVDAPPLAMGVAMAYTGKAAALRRLDRIDQAIAVYDEAIFRFSASDFPVLRGRADAALSEKVFVFLLARRYDEAIVVANGAVERLGVSGDPDALAIAVLNLGGALASEQRYEEAITVYDALIERLGEAEAPVLRARLILALSNKVEALTALGRDDDADELYSEMLARFGREVPQAFADAAARNAYDETAKAVVAGMLLKQALAFAELDHEPEALVTVENLLERFGNEPGADFEPLLAMAREFRDRLREDAEGSDPDVP